MQEWKIIVTKGSNGEVLAEMETPDGKRRLIGRVPIWDGLSDYWLGGCVEQFAKMLCVTPEGDSTARISPRE